VNKKKLLI